MGLAAGRSRLPSCVSHAFLVVAGLFILASIPCEAQLSSSFYDNTCPNALTTIRKAIRTAVSRERRMAASLIRLHFHDCFVQVLIQSQAQVLFPFGSGSRR